ncbi:hypothetical protein AAFP30_24600 [Gordonia sp. CPCC 205515]|uniref:hypothetical protein n=1 Tax=Gordonia sp. CPCC 205515 TaxID=3140791 RepID=UPI003AF384E8
MTLSNPLENQIVVPPSEAEAYLSQMSIRAADLYEAIAAGDVAAGNLTTHHPVIAPGIERWIHSTGHLRERLADTGRWSGSDPQNRPVSTHSSGAWIIALIGGNEATGDSESAIGPKAARSKGKATEEAAKTIPLFSLGGYRASVKTEDGPPSGNWFVLYYRDEDQVRIEVSLPAGFDGSLGQFTGWRIRVILEPWQPEDSVRRPLDIGGQDVDFRVEAVG